MNPETSMIMQVQLRLMVQEMFMLQGQALPPDQLVTMLQSNIIRLEFSSGFKYITDRETARITHIHLLLTVREMFM